MAPPRRAGLVPRLIEAIRRLVARPQPVPALVRVR